MARALGLFLVVFGIGVATRATTLDLLLPAFFQDGALVFVTAVFGMAVGAAMIAAHNRWSGAAAIIVSLFGWATFLRSALLLLAPTIVASIAVNVLHIEILPLVAGLIAAIIGAYLIFVGWFAKGPSTQ
jgi:hypothetical protein